MRRLVILALVLSASVLGTLRAGRATAGDAASDAPKPLALHNAKDPVTGMDASSEATLVWEGLEIQFACADSITKFQADPAGFAAELLRDLAAQRDALHGKLAAVHGALEAVLDASAPPADAKVCPCGGACHCADGKCAGENGGPCKDGADGKCPGGCKDAKTGAPVEPAKPAPAVAPTKPAPLTIVDLVNSHCPVMPEHEAQADSTVTYRNVKVRLCCPACTKKFLANPEAYLTQLSSDPAVAARLRDARAAWDAANPAPAK